MRFSETTEGFAHVENCNRVDLIINDPHAATGNIAAVVVKSVFHTLVTSRSKLGGLPSGPWTSPIDGIPLVHNSLPGAVSIQGWASRGTANAFAGILGFEDRTLWSRKCLQKACITAGLRAIRMLGMGRIIPALPSSGCRQRTSFLAGDCNAELGTVIFPPSLSRLFGQLVHTSGRTGGMPSTGNESSRLVRSGYWVGRGSHKR